MAPQLAGKIISELAIDKGQGSKNSTAPVAEYPALTFSEKGFWFLIELVYLDTMSEVFISYEQAIDRALRKAYGILAIVSAPAYFLGGYRSLVVDYAPLHLTIISFVWLSFFALAMIRSEAVTLSIILLFLIS